MDAADAAKLDGLIDFVATFEALLPRHDVSLHLEHNPQRGYYETVAEHDRDEQNHWVSEAQRARAIAINDCWVLHWYPDTPIGSYRVYAADLAALIGYAKLQDPRP